MTGRARLLAAAVAAALALPAGAYLLPVPSILRRLAERRAAQGLATFEATGTLQAGGPGGEAVLGAGGVRGAGGLASIPARIAWKVPGRCRLELLPQEADAERPWVLVRDETLSGSPDLTRDPAFVAAVRAVCSLLALGADAESPDRPPAAALSRRGVALADVNLGRFDGRIAWVVGGRASDPKPLCWIDKEGYQPMRLQFSEAGTPVDVRLLGWGSPTGGDWAPRALEVHAGGALRLRFTTERTAANPRLPDADF